MKHWFFYSEGRMGRRFWGLCFGAAAILLVGRVVGPYVYARVVLDSQLRQALDKADAPSVIRLVRQGADPNVAQKLMYPDGTGIVVNTPLLLAVTWSPAADVRMLLKRGANPEIEGQMFFGKPLGWACQGGRADKVTVLLEGGAAPNAVDREGHTAVYRLAGSTIWPCQSIACAKALIKHGADLNRREPYLTSCAYAESKGNRELAAFLKASGGLGLEACLDDVVRRGPIAAVKSGEFAAVERLVRRGVPFDKAEADGETPLMAAAALRDERVLRYLLKRTPHRSSNWINARNDVGWTALHYAVGRNNNIPMVQELIAAGAEVDAVDSFKRTPLIEAIAIGRYGFIKPLLNGGADPDFCPQDGISARDWAKKQAALGAVTALMTAAQSLGAIRKVN